MPLINELHSKLLQGEWLWIKASASWLLSVIKTMIHYMFVGLWILYSYMLYVMGAAEIAKLILIIN